MNFVDNKLFAVPSNVVYCGNGNYTFSLTPKKVIGIKDYKIINDKVVIVTFVDGTTEKAVCNPEDTFDIERAVEICICKKMFGGTKAYNDAIRKALKQIDAINKKRKEDEELAKLIARKKEKAANRKKLKQEKIRKEMIDIQVEAYLKAMKMYNEENVY